MNRSPLPADARPIAPDLLTEDQVRVLSDVAQALSSIVRLGSAAGSADVRAPSAGSVTGNTYRTGADATTGVCAR